MRNSSEHNSASAYNAKRNPENNKEMNICIIYAITGFCLKTRFPWRAFFLFACGKCGIAWTPLFIFFFRRGIGRGCLSPPEKIAQGTSDQKIGRPLRVGRTMCPPPSLFCPFSFFPAADGMNMKKSNNLEAAQGTAHIGGHRVCPIYNVVSGSAGRKCQMCIWDFFIVKAVGIYAFFRPAAGRQKGDLVANSGYSWSVLCWSKVGMAVY